MVLSVVMPSYNQRDQVAACLDAVADLTTDTEVIVVNGPSTDGSSGMLRDREDVDCVVECSSRNLNVARNIGIREASNDKIALLSPQFRVPEGWGRAIVETLGGRVDAVSGPVSPTDDEETDEIGEVADRTALPINGGNLAVTRAAITALDGFDEYLDLGGARDFHQRLQHVGLHLVWHPEMRVESITAPDGAGSAEGAIPPAGWQDQRDPDWGVRYRSRAYLRVKNGGLRPGVIASLVAAALRDGTGAARDVMQGKGQPSAWVGNGVSVLRNAVVGCRDGRSARRADRTTARNPHGLSRTDEGRIVARVDRRSEASP